LNGKVRQSESSFLYRLHEEKFGYRRANFSSMWRHVREGRIPGLDKPICRKKPTVLTFIAELSLIASSDLSGSIRTGIYTSRVTEAASKAMLSTLNGCAAHASR
jgi:hypothetical protein